MDHEGIISHGGLRHLVDLPLLPRPGLRTTLISGRAYDDATGIVAALFAEKSKFPGEKRATGFTKRLWLFHSETVQSNRALADKHRKACQTKRIGKISFEDPGKGLRGF